MVGIDSQSELKTPEFITDIPTYTVLKITRDSEGKTKSEPVGIVNTATAADRLEEPYKTHTYCAHPAVFDEKNNIQKIEEHAILGKSDDLTAEILQTTNKGDVRIGRVQYKDEFGNLDEEGVVFDSNDKPILRINSVLGTIYRIQDIKDKAGVLVGSISPYEQTYVPMQNAASNSQTLPLLRRHVINRRTMVAALGALIFGLDKV